MSFESDLHHALRAATARARTRVDEVRERGDALEVAEAEIKLLRIQVETLTRLVVELASLEVAGGGAQIGKLMIELAGPLVDFDGDDGEPEATATQTAYRGAVAGVGSTLCSRCGAMLDEDGPEMTQSTGRVCTSCFAHGGS